MAKFVINVGGKVHTSTESGTVDKDKFQVNEKGSEKQEEQSKEDTSKKEDEKRK